LRQQLILAQVRIMELEDQRDELAPKLAEVEKLLGEAQILAEAKVAEAAHLEQVRTDLQSQYDHLKHVQHVTHTALATTREEVQSKSRQVEALLSETELLQTLIRQLSASEQANLEQISKQNRKLTALCDELTALCNETTAHVARIDELDNEQRTMKVSRSWRWTAWLRSLERRFR